MRPVRPAGIDHSLAVPSLNLYYFGDFHPFGDTGRKIAGMSEFPR